MHESGYVEVPDGHVWYTRDGIGPAVLLIHGGMVDLRMFDGQVETLSAQHSLIRVDLRGYGQSPPPPSVRYRHCDDVAVVLDTLGFDRAVVVGSSFGGGVALDFAFAYPQRTAGLILTAPTIFAGWDWREELPAMPFFAVARSGGMPAVRQAILDAPLLVSTMTHPAAAAAFTDMVNDYSGWHFEHRDPARWAENDAAGRLEDVEAPALVVFGAHDVLDHRLMGHALLERLPCATGSLWPNSGHMPNMEEPDAFNEAVIDFLSGVYPAEDT